MEIEKVISRFNISRQFLSGTQIHTGHINDTFLIHTTGNEKYVLQRINHKIFKNIPELTNNILIITRHIADKIDSNE